MLIGPCSGLKYLHSAGIVHRDLKPDNIGMLDGFKVRILDLGCSRSLDDDGYVTSDSCVVCREVQNTEVAYFALFLRSRPTIELRK